MSKTALIKLSSLGLAIAIISGCATQLNVAPSTRVKVYENSSTKNEDAKVLVPGQKYSEKSNFVIVDTGNSPVMKSVRFLANNGKYVEVDLSIVAKVKEDQASITKVTNSITPSAIDNRGIPFQSVWDTYASNPVEVALIDFFNKPENQNLNAITRQVLDGYIKNSVASTPIQIENLSVVYSVITDPQPIYEFKVMQPVKHTAVKHSK